MTVYRYGPEADWDRVREGACPYCAEPLEQRDDHGWCAGDPEIGFRVTSYKDKPVLTVHRQGERFPTMFTWAELERTVINPVAALYGDRHPGDLWWRNPGPLTLAGFPIVLDPTVPPDTIVIRP